MKRIILIMSLLTAGLSLWGMTLDELIDAALARGADLKTAAANGYLLQIKRREEDLRTGWRFKAGTGEMEYGGTKAGEEQIRSKPTLTLGFPYPLETELTCTAPLTWEKKKDAPSTMEGSLNIRQSLNRLLGLEPDKAVQRAARQREDYEQELALTAAEKETVLKLVKRLISLTSLEKEIADCDSRLLEKRNALATAERFNETSDNRSSGLLLRVELERLEREKALKITDREILITQISGQAGLAFDPDGFEIDREELASEGSGPGTALTLERLRLIEREEEQKALDRQKNPLVTLSGGYSNNLINPERRPAEWDKGTAEFALSAEGERLDWKGGASWSDEQLTLKGSLSWENSDNRKKRLKEEAALLEKEKQLLALADAVGEDERQRSAFRIRRQRLEERSLTLAEAQELNSRREAEMRYALERGFISLLDWERFVLEKKQTDYEERLICLESRSLREEMEKYYGITKEE